MSIARSATQHYLRVSVGLCAIISLLLGIALALNLSQSGLPDGYVTPYARQTIPVLKWLVAFCILQSTYFFCIAIIRKRMKVWHVVVQVCAAIVLTLAPMLLIEFCPQLDACQRLYQTIFSEPLDNGTGG